VFAEADGKKSTVAEISTMGIKSGKVINETLYLDGSIKQPISKDQLLEVIVKNSKTKKAIANAEITITNKDGFKYNATTDEKGYVKGIELNSNTKYELIAVNEGSASEPISFTTPSNKSKKQIIKTVFIESTAIVSNNTSNNNSSVQSSNLPATEFEFYFTYNKKKINDADPIWSNFIDKIVELSKQKSVVVSITSSASKVPCRGGNKRLASARAKKLQANINEAVAAKGGDVSKLTFVKKSKVAGPAYKGDFNLGRKKYEKFQFVKAKAN
jgi:hypothetical protein